MELHLRIVHSLPSSGGKNAKHPRGSARNLDALREIDLATSSCRTRASRSLISPGIGTLVGASTQWLGFGMAPNPARKGRLVAADCFRAVRRCVAAGCGSLSPSSESARLEWKSSGNSHTGDFVALCRRSFGSAALFRLSEDRALSGFGQAGRVECRTRGAGLRPGALVAWQDHRWFNGFAIHT